MRDSNDYFRDFLGVTRWHELGYTGKNCIVGTGENLYKNQDHATNTADIFKEFAPDASLVYCGKDNEYFSRDITFIRDFVNSNNLTSMFMSYTSENVDFGSLSDLDEFTLLASIGNDNEQSYNDIAIYDNVISVGAYYLRYDSSKDNYYPVPTQFSSVSEYIDFSAPCMVDTSLQINFSGTSCSAPILCGMVTLINDFFIEKTGKPLSYVKMYEFLKDNSVDLKEIGFDNKTGFGMVILPEPSTIDICKYMEVNEMYNDDINIASWAKDAVYFLKQTGIMTGSDGYFRPQDSISREEMAVIAYRIINYLNVGE